MKRNRGLPDSRKNEKGGNTKGTFFSSVWAAIMHTNLSARTRTINQRMAVKVWQSFSVNITQDRGPIGRPPPGDDLTSTPLLAGWDSEPWAGRVTVRPEEDRARDGPGSYDDRVKLNAAAA